MDVGQAGEGTRKGMSDTEGKPGRSRGCVYIGAGCVCISEQGVCVYRKLCLFPSRLDRIDDGEQVQALALWLRAGPMRLGPFETG